MKTDVTLDLEKRIDSYINKQGVWGCPEVTLNSERVDYMSIDCNSIVRCFEIKISLSDFNSKASHTFVGNYNYYVVPVELVTKIINLIPDDIGLLVPHGEHHVFAEYEFPGTLKCIIRPKKRLLSKYALKEIQCSMIRALRRERDKFLVDSNSEKRISDLKRQLSKQERHSKSLDKEILRLLGDNSRMSWAFKNLYGKEAYQKLKDEEYRLYKIEKGE